jgi:hypothetical protein
LQEIEPTDEAATKIIDKINSEDWKQQFYGFNDLRSFYKYHPKEFETYLPKFKELIKEGVDDLRSSICRNSLILVNEVFSTAKDLTEKNENGDITPYDDFAVEVLPLVCKKVADDKEFLSSKAVSASELIAQHCTSRRITESLCELSDSKSIVIGSQASNALRINSLRMDEEQIKNKDNIEKLLRVISEDLGKQYQISSPNKMNIVFCTVVVVYSCQYVFRIENLWL